MKIVCKDNYARESRADILICENVSEYWGNRIIKALNYRHVIIHMWKNILIV